MTIVIAYLQFNVCVLCVSLVCHIFHPHAGGGSTKSIDPDCGCLIQLLVVTRKQVCAGRPMLSVLVDQCCLCWWISVVCAGGSVLSVLVDQCCLCWWIGVVCAGRLVLSAV